MNTIKLDRTRREVEYKSYKWYKLRQNGLGGTDCPPLLGVNTFKTIPDLWMEKVQKVYKDISNLPHVQYGINNEQRLYDMFKAKHADEYYTIDTKNIMYTLNDFMHASIDGLLQNKKTGEFGVLEIKTACINNEKNYEKWNNKIPDAYYLQLLHYLLVTGYEYAILFVEFRKNTDNGLNTFTKEYMLNINSFDKYKKDMELLYEAEYEFWHNFVIPKKIPYIKE